MSRNRPRFLGPLMAALAGAGLALLPLVAAAQQTEQPSGALEEVIVTAQKRAANR
jgi:invasion protein IalB